MAYTAHDVAIYLTGGDGEWDDGHNDCPKIGIAGPLEDESLRFVAYGQDGTETAFRVTVTQVSR